MGLLPSFFMTAPPLCHLAIWSETQASGNSFASDQSLSKGCRTVLLARLKLNAGDFFALNLFPNIGCAPAFPEAADHDQLTAASLVANRKMCGSGANAVVDPERALSSDLAVWLPTPRLLSNTRPLSVPTLLRKSSFPDLTAEDLKDLGVSVVGHRRALLNAIADLRSDRNATEAPSAVFEARTAPPKDTAAERRQVTVVFSDLVGSTALSGRMDPEDLREIISAYQKCVAETVQRFGGFVAKYMGDGVLVYFGYPQAHEDDAERAVRAALELVVAVSGLKTHAALQARIGIATGLVVVGDLIGSGASQEQAIVGETPNLAARLQGIAEPNSVVIAESTRKLVGNLFDLLDLGSQELKGITGAVRAWAALRPASVESCFDALHAGGLTELVGREEELELLLRRWAKAKTGEGQVVLLSGEPGIGKSRLTAALLEHLATEPHTRLRYFCSPQHTDSALYPIISQMERAAGFAHDDPPQAKLDKLDALLAQSSTSAQDAALLAQMLSLPIELTPQQRRQRTLEALVSQIVALSRQNPLLMIFEDAHWTDPTTLELFGRIVDRIATHHRGGERARTPGPDLQGLPARRRPERCRGNQRGHRRRDIGHGL